jgi:hypothetical protein
VVVRTCRQVEHGIKPVDFELVRIMLSGMGQGPEYPIVP